MRMLVGGVVLLVAASGAFAEGFWESAKEEARQTGQDAKAGAKETWSEIKKAGKAVGNEVKESTSAAADELKRLFDD